jgi:drug/metabolite transporter (DMT)-like permease
MAANPAKNRPLPPQLVLLVGILAVSAASIFIRFAQQEAASLVVAAYRMGVAGLVMAFIALPGRRHELRQLSRRDLALAGLSGLFLALHFATWIQSLAMTTVASSVVLVTTSPLWLALLAHWLLGERIRRGTAIGLGVALLGAIVIGVSDSCLQTAVGLACPPLSEFMQGEAFVGNLLALAGALTGAGYFLIGRSLRQKLSLTSYVFLVYASAGLILVLMVAASGLPATGFSPPIYVWLVLLGLVPQLIGHSSFNWALGQLPAAYISLPLLAEPLATTLLAIVILGEVPSGLKLVGAALILAGILLGNRRARQKTLETV